MDQPMSKLMTEELNTEYYKNTNEKLGINEAKFDLAFMAASRNDTKANRSLCRGEYLDLILRLAHIKYRIQRELELNISKIKKKKP